MKKHYPNEKELNHDYGSSLTDQTGKVLTLDYLDEIYLRVIKDHEELTHGVAE